MQHIFLIRHGAPQIPAHTCLGRMDVPLSEEGHLQAQALKRFFADMGDLRVFSSPLRRCVETAEYLGRDVQIVPEMQEIDMGIWDGLPFARIKEEFSELYAQRGEDIAHFAPPGGESFLMLQERVVPAFLQLAAGNAGDIAIVAHAGVNRVLMCAVEREPLSIVLRIPQPYGCINEIWQEDGAFSVDFVAYQP